MAHEMPAVRPAGGAQVGKFIILGVIAVGIGLFLYFDLGRFLSLESLKANRDHLLAFTEDNYTAAVGLFILLYIAVTGLSLPGATILTLAGGFLFGASSPPSMSILARRPAPRSHFSPRGMC